MVDPTPVGLGALDTLPPAAPPGVSSTDPTMAPSTEPAALDPSAPTMGSAPSATGPRRVGDALRRGDAIGRYVVVDFLGAGGMGAVYSAYDPELDRKVAVKVMLGGGRMDDHERMRLVREAQALAKLQHPNVVAVYDAGQHEGRVFVAMEFVRGRTLSSWRTAETRSWDEIVAVFLAAGRGLAAAHAQGLVHRDFKPDNVMLGDDGRVRVMDFGLARVQGSSEPTQDRSSASSSALSMELTAAGAVMGTPAYMAPEQFAAKEVDGRTDQFSFCVALFEALAGHRPFAGTSMPELVASVCTGQARPLPAGIPRHARRVLARGLAPAPAERFATMDELLAVLEQDPRRRNRWIAAGIGGALAIAGVFAVRGASRMRAETACASEGAAIETDWNRQVAEDVRVALIASGVAYAASTAEHVIARLEPYAAQWAELREQTCVAATIERTMDDDLRRRTDLCLDERRSQLAELVAQLQIDPSEMVSGAVLAATKLETVESCADVGWLLQQPAVTPAVHAQVGELRGRYGRALIRIELGRVERLGEELDAIATAAAELGDGALQARARAARGHLYEMGGDYEAAERELVEAEHQAGALGADEVAATASRLLVQLAHRKGDGPGGLRWGRRAQMWLDRLGAPADDLRRADLVHHLGNVHHVLGDLDATGEHYRRALAIRTALLGERHPAVAATLHNLAGYSYSRKAYDDAVMYSEQALAIWEQTLGLDHPEVASTISNLGAIQLGRGKTAEGKALLQRALELRERTLGPDHVDVATTLHNLGRAHVDAGDREQALRVLQRALTIRKAKLPADHPHLRSTIELLERANAEG